MRGRTRPYRGRENEQREGIMKIGAVLAIPVVIAAAAGLVILSQSPQLVKEDRK